jgi:hypothetical protein
LKLNNQPVIKDKQAIYTVADFDLATYEDVINIRTLPLYEVSNRTITFPANYLDHFTFEKAKLPLSLTDGLFDYQQVISKVAWLKERYAI